MRYSPASWLIMIEEAGSGVGTAGALLLIVSFAGGKAFSLWLYRQSWENGARAKAAPSAARFLLRPSAWLIHLLWLSTVARTSWPEGSLVRLWCGLLCTCMTIEAAGRWGAADLGRFFLRERVFVILTGLAVWIHPAFLHLFLILSCCLQYPVASWRPGPPYSNLLGFEFLRGSACALWAAQVVSSAVPRIIGIPDLSGSLSLAALLTFQASSYVNHALAKSALGPAWHSWITGNRLHCLFINAWLRGWRAGSRNEAGVLASARRVARIRVPLCAAVWLMELAWLVVPSGAQWTGWVPLATAGFHAVVHYTTGLAGWSFLANHLFLGWALASGRVILPGFPGWMVGSILCLGAQAGWLAWFRPRLLQDCRSSGQLPPSARFHDPADHLMAWWDGPCMRMFSWRAELADGTRCWIPVPRLSPYDTAITDMHTHVMVLGLDNGLDPAVPDDRQVARTGVWGLLVERDEKDRMYRWMDDGAVPGFPLRSPALAGDVDPGAPSAAAFARLIAGLNRIGQSRAGQILLRRPHFPGEDLAPDICPLLEDFHLQHNFRQSIRAVALHRIITFYDGRRITLIENSVARIIPVQ